MTAAVAPAVVEAAARLAALPFLFIALAFGAIAYFVSRSYGQRHGVTPWRMPSWLWGIIGFFSLLLWGILILIAVNTTKKPEATWQAEPPYPSFPPGPTPYGTPPGATPYGTAPYGTAPGATPYATAPGAAPGATPYGTAPGAAPDATASGPPPYPAAAPLPPPGWFPDPSGRHQSRYWDGSTWTEHVSDGSVTSTDPVQ